MGMLSAAAASEAATSVEFMVPAPALRTARPASRDSGRRTDDGSRRAIRAAERGAPGVRVTELHFRELHVRQVRAGEARGVLRAEAARAVDMRGRQLRPAELRTGRVRAGGRLARQPISGAATPVTVALPTPLRLTRRGRAVVAVLVILAAATAATVLWLTMAGGAQAADHGQSARAGFQGLTRMVVEPGQTLWSIASAAEPSAETRQVIQQIIDANALGGTTIHAGQQLWVPRG
jgi:hypothetical protein